MKHFKSAKIGRRQFLIGSSGTLITLALTATHAKASLIQNLLTKSNKTQPEPEERRPFFVFLTTDASAGLDVTLGLDPQTHHSGLTQKDVFLEYRPDDMIKVGAIKLGPAAAPLKIHAEQISIINGIMMRRDSGHEGCLEYIQTGDPSGTAGTLTAEHAAHFSDSCFGAIYNTYSFKEGLLSSFSTSITSLQNKLIEQNNNYAQNLNDFNDESNSPLHEAFQALKNANQKSKQMKSLIETLPSLSLESTEDEQLYKLIAAALMTGASYEAQIQISNQNFTLDTHTDHEKRHLQSQTLFWKKVSDLFSTFKKIPYLNGSLFDSTLFYVAAEFSRTPALNPSKGKDHNPFTNSVLLAGNGIKTGKMIGKSHILTGKSQPNQIPIHIGLPFDFTTHQTIESISQETKHTSMIYPENVIATLREVMNLPKNGSKSIKSLIN